jgi:nucleoid DNA-binding protein
MIKTDIINNVAGRLTSPASRRSPLEAVLDAMKESMKRGERIELGGFGVFRSNPAKRESAETPVLATKCASPRVKRFGSNPART